MKERRKHIAVGAVAPERRLEMFDKAWVKLASQVAVPVNAEIACEGANIHPAAV